MALVVSAGQAVGQPDWDALAAQHGGVKSTSKVAPSEAQIKEAGMGGDDDPAFQQRPIYRYYFNDGTYVDARTAANGADYAIVDYKPSSQFTQSQTPAAQSREKPTIGRVEGTPLPGGGFDNTKPIWVERDANDQQVGAAKPLTADQRQQWEREKNGGLTDQEVRDRNKPDAMVGKPTGNTRTKSENGTTVKETEYLLPDGSTVWRSQTETTQPDRVGKPTGNIRSRVEGGQTIKETEYVLPDGSTVWRSQSAPSESNQPLPADMPPFRPDPNKEGMGTIEYTTQLAALRAAGKLTDKQFTEFVGLAHQQATAEASRLDTIASAQRQMQTNAINQRQTDINASTTRLGHANTATQNALTTSLEMAGNFSPKAYAAMGGPILPAIMAIQDQRANAWGGMYQPAPIGNEGYPMLQGMQQMGMTPGGVDAPVAAAAPTAQAAAPVIPAVQQLANTANQNQIGYGAVGNVAAPTGPAPVAAPVAPAAPPAVQGTPSPVGDTGAPPVEAAPVQMVPPAVLPAILQSGVLAEVAGSGRYPADVLEEAARQLGWG